MAEKAKDKKKSDPTTKAFKEVIKKYLDKLAERDELFAKTYAKKNKNLNDCVTYIMNTVSKIAEGGHMLGVTDEEVWNMATHYYDEDDIDVGKDISMKVVVNHTVQLTDEEKEEAKKQAKERLITSERDRLTSSRKKSTPAPSAKKDEPQQSIF